MIQSVPESLQAPERAQEAFGCERGGKASMSISRAL